MLRAVSNNGKAIAYTRNLRPTATFIRLILHRPVLCNLWHSFLPDAQGVPETTVAAMLTNLASFCLAGVKGAAALSQVVIAAGALSGVALILHKKSPLDDSKPLINYDLVLLMLPALLLGVSLGGSPTCLSMEQRQKSRALAHKSVHRNCLAKSGPCD